MLFDDAWLAVARAVGAGFALALAGIWIVRRALARMALWMKRTPWMGDDVLVESLRRPAVLWVVLLSAFVAFRLLELPPRLASLADGALLTALILSISIWASDLAVRLLVLGGSRAAPPMTVPGLARVIVRGALLALGAMVVLNTLGISIAPLLTTLGIGGLAVALGLQETMTNLFAGIHVTLARNIRVGDFVKLETGDEGFVDDISWRTTRIRMLPNAIVVVPNSRLAQSVVTNYDLPSRDMAVLVQVGVHYASDLELVERVTCEVGADVMRSVPGGVPEFEPFIRFHTFGDSSIDFTVILRGQSFVDNFLIKHEFIKRLSKRYAHEGIVIPFPIRAINLAQEGVVTGAAAG